MELSQLLQRCRQGDELAWEALVRTYQSRIYGFACYYTGHREDARDLAQEVFIRVYQKLDQLPDPEAFPPWLIRITRNACIDHLRRKSVRPPAQDLPVGEARDLASPGANPEEQWAAGSRKRLVHRALSHLTELNREILLLQEMQGLPLEQIATLLNVPLGTIKSRAWRARLELAEKVRALSGE